MLNRLTTLFLDTAELRVKEQKDLTLDYWRATADNVLLFNNKDILQGKGNVSNSEMEASVIAEYQKFDSRRKKDDALKADQEDVKMLEEVVTRIKALD